MKSLALHKSFSYIVSIADSDITPPIKHIYIYFEIQVCGFIKSILDLDLYLHL